MVSWYNKETDELKCKKCGLWTESKCMNHGYCDDCRGANDRIERMRIKEAIDNQENTEKWFCDMIKGAKFRFMSSK